MDLFSELLVDARSGREAYLVTLIGVPSDGQTACLGQNVLIYPDGSTKGEVGDARLTAQLRKHVLSLNPQEPLRFQLPQIPDLDFLCDCLELPQRAVIFGGGHISQPLAEFLSLVGYEVAVVDDRPDFANSARFPRATNVLCCAFADSYGQLPIYRTTAVIIVTRGHRHDLDCLRQMLKSDAFYLGMIGSRAKVGAVFEALRQEGASPDLLRRVYAPIGLDIHAKTPAEIALSITAEIVSVAKGGSCQPLSSLRGGMVR